METKYKNEFSKKFLKRLKKAEKEKEKNRLIEIDPSNIWESLGIKKGILTLQKKENVRNYF